VFLDIGMKNNMAFFYSLFNLCVAVYAQSSPLRV
jgi:hypothetical protein